MKQDADDKAARNERLKLSATFLNNVAVAVIATGLLGPVFAILYGISSAPAEQAAFIGLAAPVLLLLGAFIHFVARDILGGIEA